MPSKLKPPGGERTMYAVAFILLGLYLCYSAAMTGRLWTAAHGGGLVFAGVALWFWRPWARVVGVVMLVPIISFSISQLFTQSFSVLGLVAACACSWMAYAVWREFSPQNREASDGEDKPMVSFVLLLREPRFIEARILAEIVSSAWGGTYQASDMESETEAAEPESNDAPARFVIGQSPLFMVQSPEAMFIVNNFDRPYFDELSKAAEAMPELRLRHAVEQHRAWISVDLIGAPEEESERVAHYPAIGKLIAELSGPDCLAIYHPASGKINAWDQSLEEKLRSPNALEEFAAPVHVPVIQVADDDPRMVAAVEEARRRWPEFVAVFKAKTSETCSVKAPVTVGEHTEFIWVDVVGLEPEYVHGTLANDPVALEGKKLGDRVEVAVKDINDWFYLKDDEPVGWFTVKVIAAIQKEQRKSQED